MREERLLARIRAWEREPARRGVEDPRRLSDSIRSHLQRILNTRRGNVPIAEDYGIPEFSEYAALGEGAIAELEKAIRTTIQKYEPRLRGVRVTFLPRDENRLHLEFRITGRLAADAKAGVQFETTMEPDGRIRLRG